MKYIILLLFTSTLLFSSEHSALLNHMIFHLGKIIILTGFIGTFIIYMMTHRGSILFAGIILSLLSGAMVAIAKLFLEIDALESTQAKESTIIVFQIIFILIIVFVVNGIYQEYLDKKLKNYENSLTYL